MIRLIITVGILLLALSFFGISIRAIVESPTGHDNLMFVWEVLRTGWGVAVGWYHLIVDTILSVLPEQQ
jgi:hypothetical protein